MGLGPQRKDSKTFGTTVYGLTHPSEVYSMHIPSPTIQAKKGKSRSAIHQAAALLQQ